MRWNSVPPHPGHQQAASSVLYTTSCKHSLVLLMMGEIIPRNMLSWLKVLIKKLSFLHPVGCLYYCVTHWCMQNNVGDIWETVPTCKWIILPNHFTQMKLISLLFFYVLLTVHLSIILVINQLNAQNLVFLKSLFYASTFFEHHVLIIRRSKLYYTASGIFTLSRWPSGAQVDRGLSTGQPPRGVMIPDAV